MARPPPAGGRCSDSRVTTRVVHSRYTRDARVAQWQVRPGFKVSYWASICHGGRVLCGTMRTAPAAPTGRAPRRREAGECACMLAKVGYCAGTSKVAGCYPWSLPQARSGMAVQVELFTGSIS